MSAACRKSGGTPLFRAFTGFASRIRSRTAKPATYENLWVFIRSDAPVVRAGWNIRGCGPLSTPGFFDRLRTWRCHVLLFYHPGEWLFLRRKDCYVAGALADARRGDSLAACSPGGRFRRFTPRGVSFTAGRGPRGGVMVWQHADREAASPALRRAVCCVGAGPAGRCGYFSFSAYRRRQRKVPRKEARHSYFFERDSVQVHKSCRKEAGIAAFLSASQTPKGKKSRPKERPWLPQERGCSENGGGPARAAERRARRSGQRNLRGVNCATARSARSGSGTRGRPWGQHNRELHSAT